MTNKVIIQNVIMQKASHDPCYFLLVVFFFFKDNKQPVACEEGT